MITGTHTVLYSANPEADRDFLKDVFHLTHVDIGSRLGVYQPLHARPASMP